MIYLTLEDIKKHLNIDSDFTDDDTYLESLEAVAIGIIERDIDYKFSEMQTLPDALKHALLLVIGNFYDNRESLSPVNISELPQSLGWILDLYRDYSIDTDIKP